MEDNRDRSTEATEQEKPDPAVAQQTRTRWVVVLTESEPESFYDGAAPESFDYDQNAAKEFPDQEAAEAAIQEVVRADLREKCVAREKSV